MAKLPRGPHDGLETDPPTSSVRASAAIIAEGDRIMDELDELFDREPPKPPNDGDDDSDVPTSRRPPGPLSRLAVRLDDGAFLVSLEDAADHDVSSRETITFLVLSAEEKEHALPPVSDAIFAAAANIVGRLPRRKL